jgi:Tol biopolymer transport system component
MLRKLLLLVAGFLAQATMVQAQSALLARKVFSTDSMQVTLPALSPDEKWLVFARSISNQENRVLIQAVSGGAPRELLTTKGLHRWFNFAPAGDRLVFTSTLPRRDPTDNAYYIVSAPFDTRNGILTGSPRQISLDGVHGGNGRLMLAISPDGQSVAYVGSGSFAIKLLPVTGGTARTLVEPPRLPHSLSWSPDGQFLSYELLDQPKSTRMRVSLDGGAPIVLARSNERLGPLSPDGAFSVNIPFWDPNGPSKLHAFGSNGQLLGEVKLPPRLAVISGLTGNGKYIIGSSDETVYPVKVAPVAGGQIRQVSAGSASGNWSENSDVQVMTPEDGYMTLTVLSPGGEQKSHVRLPDEAVYRNIRRVSDEFLIYWYPKPGVVYPANLAQLRVLNLKDGSRGELSEDNVWVVCCEPGAPRRMPIEPSGTPLRYYRLVGNRMQLRTTRVGGESSLIADYPAGTVAFFAPGQNGGVYREIIKDSVRLQLFAGVGRPPKTLATFARAASPGEFRWSRDGRLFAVTSANPKTLTVYRFDGDGNFQRSDGFSLPFENYYEINWLPDGSGLVMIAQPRGGPVTVVALVKLADPQHPILLAQDDPGEKSGLVLSPDGKHVLYHGEEKRGSSIYLIDVAEMMKQLQVRK